MTDSTMTELRPEASEDLAVASGPRIVVADDDATTRLILAGVLTAEGYQVAEAADGHEALQRARELRPALVVLDVLMPGMDGFEVCAALRGRDGTAGPPVLILTGQDQEDAVPRAFLAGATDFASKPITPALLLHRVRFLLRNAEVVERVRRSEAGLENAQRIALLGSWEWHLPTGSTMYSRTAQAVLGFAAEGEGLWFAEYADRVHPDDRAAFREAVETARAGGHPMNLRHRIRRPDGAIRQVQTRAELDPDGEQRPTMMRGTIQDVSAQAEAEEKIRQLALFDQLTGLPNRTQFAGYLRLGLAEAARLGNRAAVLLLDIQQLKQINGTRGHALADALLAAVSSRLRTTVRQSDAFARAGDDHGSMLARLGGGEFMIALGGIERGESAAVAAHRILEAFRAPFRVGEEDFTLSANLGISVYPEDGSDVDELVRHAESALAQARRGERNGFEFYDRALSQAVAARCEMATSIARAVEQEEFTLFYQPQVDAEGRLVGAEALLRWILPDGRIIPAATVMPVLEEQGLVPVVVEWTMRTALRQIEAWDRAGLVLPHLSINLSPRQLAVRGIVEQLTGLVREAGISPHRITLELIEQALLDHPGAAAILERLRGAGFRIALDDFGTGYSALSYLRRFPLDLLKIDRSFIRDVPADQRQAAIVSAMIHLARELGIEPLCEGVEEEPQRRFLVEAGVRLMQGYLLGRPMPAEELARRLPRGVGAA